MQLACFSGSVFVTILGLIHCLVLRLAGQEGWNRSSGVGSTKAVPAKAVESPSSCASADHDF